MIFLCNLGSKSTSFPGSFFSASLSRWNRDPGCGWSRDHLSIQNRRVGGYSRTFGREENPVALPFQQNFLPPRVWVVTWPVATRVSVPTTKGGREERPWERGWFKISSVFVLNLVAIKANSFRKCWSPLQHVQQRYKQYWQPTGIRFDNHSFWKKDLLGIDYLFNKVREVDEEIGNTFWEERASQWFIW